MPLVTVISTLKVQSITFVFFCFYLCGIQKRLYTKSNFKMGKSTFVIFLKKQKCRLRRETKTFQSISFLLGRILSIFQHNVNGPIHSGMDTKMLIPIPKWNFPVKTVHQRFSILGKNKSNVQVIYSDEERKKWNTLSKWLWVFLVWPRGKRALTF